MLYWSPMSFCPSFCSLSGWWNYFLTRKVVCKYLHGEQPCINVGMSKNNSLVLHGNGYSPAWSPQTLTHLDVEKCLPVLTYFIVGCMKQLPGEFKEKQWQSYVSMGGFGLHSSALEDGKDFLQDFCCVHIASFGQSVRAAGSGTELTAELWAVWCLGTPVAVNLVAQHRMWWENSLDLFIYLFTWIAASQWM